MNARNCAAPSLFVFALLACLTNQVAEAVPPAGTDWAPYEEMTDEFDLGVLDSEKWYDRNPHWSGRRPVLFHPSAVSVEEGELRLRAFVPEEGVRKQLPEGYTCVSGYARSKSSIRFGYFEVRAKLMDGPYPSCFWLSNHQRDEWSEIDCVEIPAGLKKYERVFQPNLHYFYGPQYSGNGKKRGTVKDHWADPSKHPLPFRTADDFHEYGVEWTPNHIRWYVDGEVMRETENKAFFQPLHMSINLESNPWFGEQPKNPSGEGSYRIDWVRAWRPVDLQVE